MELFYAHVFYWGDNWGSDGKDWARWWLGVFMREKVGFLGLD